jgi:hypothetical protein
MIRTIRSIPMIQPKIHIGHMPPPHWHLCNYGQHQYLPVPATLNPRKSFHATVLFGRLAIVLGRGWNTHNLAKALGFDSVARFTALAGSATVCSVARPSCCPSCLACFASCSCNCSCACSCHRLPSQLQQEPRAFWLGHLMPWQPRCPSWPGHWSASSAAWCCGSFASSDSCSHSGFDLFACPASPACPGSAPDFWSLIAALTEQSPASLPLRL